MAGLPSRVVTVAFSLDGRYLITASVPEQRELNVGWGSFATSGSVRRSLLAIDRESYARRIEALSAWRKVPQDLSKPPLGFLPHAFADFPGTKPDRLVLLHCRHRRLFYSQREILATWVDLKLASVSN